ncbi:hypothetical protein V8C34DRAFT_296612 [Trichoderma compactum]
MAGTTFYFVDGAQTNRAAKKLARSHVMKGKNAGRKVHRRSRLQLAPPRVNAGERKIILRRDLDKSQKEFHYSSRKALYHLSETFNYVTRLLAGPDALSDAAIMIVVTLVSQELIRKGYGNLRVHLDGLQKMIQLRGGLPKLEGSIALMMKLCKVDIMLAIQHGGPPLFFRDRMAKVRDVLARKKIDFDGNAATSCPQHHLLEPYLHDILVHMMGATSLFNNGVKLDLETLQEMILSIGYRLTQFSSSEEDRRLWRLQDSYHIGLTIWTMTVFLHGGRRQILDYKRLDRRLKEILDSDLEDHNPELALWLLILGGVWVLDGYDEHWLPSRIRLMAMRLNIRSWDKVYTIVGHFPWIHALHDDLGRALWDRAHRDELMPSWIML